MRTRRLAIAVALATIAGPLRGLASAQGCNPVCGDGYALYPEECDDGNTTGGDGCSSSCQLESTAALCAGTVAKPGTALNALRIASGLVSPTSLAGPPLDPNRVFVTEQNGYVRLIKNGVLQSTPFLDIHADLDFTFQQGLFSITFHPQYEINRRFYVSYTGHKNLPTSCTLRTEAPNVIAEYQVSTTNPDVADPSTKRVLLTIPQAWGDHDGGDIAFGPDGLLYFAVGDGGGGGFTCHTAQDDNDPLGKFYRLDVNNPPANPLSAVWAKGFRNPWRWSFDRATGDLYVADVGQELYEEVNVIPAPVPAGLNYGWYVYEGRHCYEPPTGCSLPGAVVPVLEYCHFQNDPACNSHPRGCSVTGGYVYRGCAMPDLRGRYFYSDWCGGFIRSFQGVSGGNAQNLMDHTADLAPGGGLFINSVVSFGEDARGELYIVDQGGGEIWKILPGS